VCVCVCVQIKANMTLMYMGSPYVMITMFENHK
jgi:hypothetical protein